MDMTLTENGIPKWMLKYGDKIKIFEKEKKETSTWSISTGTTRNTRGVLFGSEPFIIQKNGKKICILLMDTQGLWDQETKDDISCSIFGLSSLLSSYVIFNQKNNINTDQLKKFSVLSKFTKEVSKESKGVSKDSDKPFQHLDILLRDYEDYSKKTTLEKGIQFGATRLAEMHKIPIENKPVKEIEECFNEFNVFCFPSPGEDVCDSEYEGLISEIKPQFLQMLSYYIDRVIRGDGVKEGIMPRKIGGMTFNTREFVE